MVNLMTSLVSHLNNDAAVFAEFGNRITVDKIPDKQKYPYARLFKVANPQQYHLQGYGGQTALIQVDIYGETQSSVDDGMELIYNSLSGYRGVMGEMSVGRCFVNNVAGLGWDPETRTYHRILEVDLGTSD